MFLPVKDKIRPLALRGHHLFCLLLYIGKGYSPAFTRHFDKIVQKLNTGFPFEIVSGLDSICGGICPFRHQISCIQGATSETDLRARQALSFFLNIPGLLRNGYQSSLNAEWALPLRQGLSDHRLSLQAICGDCDWQDTCASIIASGFEQVCLFPNAIPQRRLKDKSFSESIASLCTPH